MQRSRNFLQRCHGIFLAVFFGFVLLPTSGLSSAPQALSAPEKKSLSEFSKRAQAYIREERALPADKLKPTSDVAALDRQRTTLRRALQQSRPNAQQGDLFTPQVASVFRKLLSQTLSGPSGNEIRASLDHAEPVAPTNLTINGVYPNGNGEPIQSVPATLLQNLPVLPKGLEYCIAGKTLALRDRDANMVIDFLPQALP